MTVSEKMIEAAARADAEFAGRTFDGLSGHEKTRYRERAKLMLEAAMGADEGYGDNLVRLVELTASYCHGSEEYWNDKDANVLVEMARRMAPCTEAVGADLYRLRAKLKEPTHG